MSRSTPSVAATVPDALPLPDRRALVVAAVLLYGVGDVATTAVGLAVPGIVEANPTARPVLVAHGVPGLIAFKAVVMGCFFAVASALPARHRVAVPLGLVLVGAAVTAWNLLIICRAVLA